MSIDTTPTCAIDLDEASIEDVINALLYAQKVGPVGVTVVNPRHFSYRLMSEESLNLCKWEALELLGALYLAHRGGFRGKVEGSIIDLMVEITTYLGEVREAAKEETIARMRHSNTNAILTLPNKDWMWAK